MKTRNRISILALTASAVCQGLYAQAAASAPVDPNEEIIELSPFEVTSQRDTGYQATETLAGTRIRTDLKDVGSAISVITREFLRDVGATDSSTLLQYTTNAEVAGTRGTFAGLGNATGVDETDSLRAPGGVSNRVRGLAQADSTRDFFVTDIPWDSYNVERIDIQRGPNSILFGLGSPAGIINASLRNAEFRNLGSVEARFGSYNSKRASLDLNQELVDNVLAIRVGALWNDEKYQQEPAYQKDKRVYGALRFDPQLFNRRDFRTSIRAKYEHGEIDANRPRIVPPMDSITPWFRPVDTTSLNGGVGKMALDSAYGLGSAPQNTNPWLSAGVANQQQPIWFKDGATNDLYRIYSGYVNTGALNPNGTTRGPGDSIIGQVYSDQFYRLTDLASYATNARLPGAAFGQYRQASLLDPTVFNFYDNLIDGPNKMEFEDWDAFNLDFQQTGWDDRVGVQVTYDSQKYKRGGEALLGNPSITIDVLRNFQDLSANPNFGRPYIVGGPGAGNSYESDRKYLRASLFGEVRAKDFLNEDGFLAKLLGKHRFNGVYSDEEYETENLSWRMYAHSKEWAGYWNRTTGDSSDFRDRPPVSVIYLGPSLANASTAAGANISRIGAPITLEDGNIYHFASTWTNPAGVNPADPFTVPPELTTRYNPVTAITQASNPANYVGWNSNFQDNLLRYDLGANPSLTNVAQKSLRVTKSYAGSWQGFLWNDAIVPTFGWRYDEVKGKGVNALPVTLNRQILNMGPEAYGLPTEFPTNQIFKEHSTAGGIVVHLNKLFGDRDPLPINVSLSYNKSNNFQVTDTRRNVYGQPIANPTGSTKDYGVLLSTKDGKFSFRALKYETNVSGANTPVSLQGLAGAITQGIKFRNVFLYRMSGYTWDTREQTNLTPGQRYFWTPAYVNSAGRPVADLDGLPAPLPAGATLETVAQGDAHRDASIRAWNDIQKTLGARGFFQAWGYTPATESALTDRATYEATLVGNNPAAQYMPEISSLANHAAVAPQGLAVTADSMSEGYEFEFTANPLPNWRIAFNAAKTEAVRTNVGGPLLEELVAYMDEQMAGIAGDMRQFNGNYSANNEVRQNWANWRGQYTLLKLQENSAASELREWRYNLVTNYAFTNGRLKGFGVGGSYRWQDEVVIGYPVIPGTAGQASFDLSKPYYGPAEDAIDLWVTYERKLTAKINWRIQLNVRNAFSDEGLIPISVQPDGQTWASVRVKPVQEWFVTNTFTF